jgi:hypothetical protein
MILTELTIPVTTPLPSSGLQPYSALGLTGPTLYISHEDFVPRREASLPPVAALAPVGGVTLDPVQGLVFLSRLRSGRAHP